MRAETQGFPAAAPILRRAAYVLAVAAVDTYFHEQAVVLLLSAAQSDATSAARVANYLQNVPAVTVASQSAESHIRLRLSYKTLVGPKSITTMLIASGRDESAIWHNSSFAMGNRPDRVQMQLQLFYDRRNQIAHEGDWDFVQLDFRAMQAVHLADCVKFGTSLAEAMDPWL